MNHHNSGGRAFLPSNLTIVMISVTTVIALTAIVAFLVARPWDDGNSGLGADATVSQVGEPHGGGRDFSLPLSWRLAA